MIDGSDLRLIAGDIALGAGELCLERGEAFCVLGFCMLEHAEADSEQRLFLAGLVAHGGRHLGRRIWE